MASLYEEAKYDERAFVATAFKDVASSGTLNLHLKNPSGSGVEAFVKNIVVSTQFKGEFNIYDSFSTAPNSGSSISTQNLLMDTGGTTPDSGVITANKDVSFTQDGIHLRNVIPSGGQGQDQIGGRGQGTDPILQEEREFVVEAVNDSSSQAPGSINVIYREGSAP